VSDPRTGVLFLVSTLGFGGAEKHTVTLANGLDRKRYRCSLAYLKPDEGLLPQLDSARLEAVLSLDVRHRLDRNAVGALAGHLDRLAIDIVVCANEYPTVYAWLAARRAHRRPRLVEIFHTTVFGRLKDRLQMWLYRRVFRRFDLLVYVSRNQQRYWQRRGLRARRSVVITNGVDGGRFRDTFTAAEKQATRAAHGFAANDYVVGICAALRPEKAHGDLVAAIGRLHRLGIPARCLIIGDGPERARIEAAIAALGLRGSITLTGMCPDVRGLVAACDVMVLCSHAVETFSLAALEAMALARPLVLSDIGGASEQVVDGLNGYLYTVGDIAALADRLAALASHELRTRMGAAGLQRVQELYTETAMLDRYAAELALLAEPPRERDSMSSRV
jgi:glycosyltransferase involved in cell wall biosynthesis